MDLIYAATIVGSLTYVVYMLARRLNDALDAREARERVFHAHPKGGWR